MAERRIAITDRELYILRAIIWDEQRELQAALDVPVARSEMLALKEMLKDLTPDYPVK